MTTDIKGVLLHLTNEEHSRLKKMKDDLNLTWEKFLIFLSHGHEKKK